MPSIQMPPDYNPDTFMLAKETEYGLFHESRRAARLAADLLAGGSDEDVALAHNVLEAVLACQELDPRDPHYGNFYWMREDSEVEDLNAVEFVLESLIPLMRAHGHLLAPEMQARVLAAIRLGLEEIERLDVLVAYTNITALDILNTCLGGELLGDERIARRGYEKLALWMAYTAQAGHPLEYNSPTYTSVTLRAFKRLRDHVQHAPTRRRAEAMAARLALSVALHLHPATGRWAGPHSRAYQPSIVCETPPEAEMMRQWIADGIAPSWVEPLLTPDLPLTVTETAEQSLELSFSTYQSSNFALGIASRNFNDQNNVCMAHFRRPDAARPGVLYTRYLLDDKWFGDAYHRTDRTKTRNLPDEGTFFGVQDGPRAIGVYALTRTPTFESAKAALIWTDLAAVDGIWVDGEPVTVPHKFQPGQTVVVASGAVYTAVRPLHVTRLCKAPPVRLVERDGDLVLEIYNYSGIFKRFWEIPWPGPFFQGHPLCTYYLEVADRDAFPDGAAFAAEIARGEFAEEIDPPYTYAREGQRRYSAQYSRDGATLGIALDRMQGTLLKRWTSQGECDWPMLDAPMARERAGAPVTVGEATFSAGDGPHWLAELPDDRGWVAGYWGLNPTDAQLTTPAGTVAVTGLEAGTLVWQDDDIEIQAAYAQATLDGKPLAG